MKTKHTEGEWKVMPEEVGHSYIRIRGTLAGRKFKIANVLSVEGADNREMVEVRANAKLIAAAPKLLAACRALQLEAYARGCGLRIADEAIAEAETVE